MKNKAGKDVVVIKVEGGVADTEIAPDGIDVIIIDIDAFDGGTESAEKLINDYEGESDELKDIVLAEARDELENIRLWREEQG